MTDRINDIVNIFNAFKLNEDFYITILKEAFSVGKDDEAKKIVRARDEFKNGYEISKDTIELIKNNLDKYINIINRLKEQEKNKDNNTFTTSNDTYSINLGEEISLNNDTAILTNSNDANNTNNEKEDKEEIVEDNKENINNSSSDEVSNSSDEYIKDEDMVYSSAVAKNNLEQEIARINNQINVIKSNINNSDKLPSKKDYQQLFQLEEYRNRLQGKLDNINLEESYGSNDKILNNDNRLNTINDKIKENKQKLSSNKPKFVKAILSKKISNLQKQQGKIKERQRTIVNKDLLKYYKYSFKDAKNDSRDNAISQYYKDKKEVLKEKKEAILDNVSENSNSIINNIKNRFYKYKSMPTELRIKHIENLQQNNTLKDKVGIVVGFNKINDEIANKLYPKVQNTKKQAIEKLKELSGYLQNVQQYNPDMEELYNNLTNEQPMLEATSKQR